MSDINYEAYLKEAKEGKLECFDGKSMLYQNGRAIASGMQESMDSLYKSINSQDASVIKVDLKKAKSA